MGLGLGLGLGFELGLGLESRLEARVAPGAPNRYGGTRRARAELALGARHLGEVSGVGERICVRGRDSVRIRQG